MSARAAGKARLDRTTEITVGRDCQQQLVVDAPVDLEFRMVLKVSVDRGLGAVSRAPWAIAGQFFRNVFHHGIEHHAVTPWGRQGRVGLKLFEDMVEGVVAVQADEDS
jgi:hypothetical protein